MPRLQLWNRTKGNNYKFFDRTIRQMFRIGGTEFLVHKFLGAVPQDGSPSPVDDPFPSTDVTIQDVLLLEIRDRVYDRDVYSLMGSYNVQDNDFDLTQFGIFLSNDTLYISFHINEMVEVIGRRLIPGDVLELPHLRDDLLLDGSDDGISDRPAIPKLYKIEDANRSAEGYSPTWYPHIWRVKISPITDSQEYRDLLDRNLSEFNDGFPADYDGSTDNTFVGGNGASGTGYMVGDTITLSDGTILTVDSIDTNGDVLTFTINTTGTGAPGDTLPQVSTSGTGTGFSLTLGDASTDGTLGGATSTGQVEIDISNAIIAEAENDVPNRNLEHQHLWVDEDHESGLPHLFMTDGIPPNGQLLLGSGSEFPPLPDDGSWFLRTDFTPDVLYKREGPKWVRKEFDWREAWTTANRTLLRFINNRGTVDTKRGAIDSRVPVSKIITSRDRPGPDDVS